VRIAKGQVRINGDDILEKPLGELRRLRGRVVSYVAQDPSAALNPALRIETQLMETLQVHGYGDSTTERQERLQEMLTEVLLPGDHSFLRRYPHELSGGQQQRVVLAMAFACRPRLIVLDEPTTGLDVSTQAHILETVRDLCRSHHVAALYVTHDLAVVAALADRVAVMYAGRLVEIGRQREVFHGAAHPYTRKLLQAIPDISGRYALIGIRGHAPMPGRRPEACFFAPRCDFAVERCWQEFPPTSVVSDSHSVRCFRSTEVRTLDLSVRTQAERPVRADRNEEPLLSIRGLRSGYRGTEVLHDVSLDVWAGECLALVGESGSGKTTLARCIVGLHQRSSGEVYLHGMKLPAQARARDRRSRREIQYIFQSPYSSLNPRKSVGQTIGQPLRIFSELSRHEREARIGDALERVGLSRHVMGRHPDQLSGGERQRVAIARALVAEPSLLICDEITSSLDVSVQAEIVQLLERLQRESHLGVFFVTHNLALIRNIAQDVAVMSEGRIVELGNVEEALERPHADYTRALISHTPSLNLALGS
jgi:peptide/nickel transport system ATP-binding protein